MTGTCFVKALHIWVQSVFINIDRNLTALLNQIKTNLNKCQRIPKRQSKFEINFVNRENKFKIQSGYKQTLMLYNRTTHGNVKYHKRPVWNCHSEDKHSISTDSFYH